MIAYLSWGGLLASVALIVFLEVVWTKRLRLLREGAQAELAICEQIRLTMEDLRSRDPQLEEVLSVGLIELARVEKELRAHQARIKVARVAFPKI